MLYANWDGTVPSGMQVLKATVQLLAERGHLTLTDLAGLPATLIPARIAPPRRNLSGNADGLRGTPAEIVKLRVQTVQGFLVPGEPVRQDAPMRQHDDDLPKAA